MAKALKKDLVKAKKACIGKKMKGFKFVDKIHDSYNPRMDLCINHVGEITDYIVGADKFEVDFENTTTWFYPATRALEYIVEEPKVVEKNALEEAIDDTYTAMLKEEIADLSARLDGAYKEQEQMLKELKRWVDAFPYAFKQLEEHAGEITVEDVTYHVKLISKIMEHKFGYKPKMVEL
jgi:hypothetical protein